MYTKVWNRREDKGEWLCNERGLLDWIERTTLVRLVRHWNRMLTEVAEASSLDLFEIRLDGALSSLI